MNTRFTLDRRGAGILLHLTSLPGPHGCGDLGEPARNFAAWLQSAGQRWWQMLPIGPIGAGNSPYSSYSAFAGSPLLIALEPLVAAGWLPKQALPGSVGHARRVDYARTRTARERALHAAFEGFQANAGRSERAALSAFRRRHAPWLEDYALFATLRDRFEQRAWTKWPRALRQRRPDALRAARRELCDAIDYHVFTQYLFDGQWRTFRRDCNERGIGLVGDIPIFVSHDSADVWANPGLFRLRSSGEPEVVSGVPPDYFSRTGQRWGHPLYAWKQHTATGFAWWIERFRAMLSRFDAVRIDHFLGFNRCWAVPGRAKTAQRGTWTPSPGLELFRAVRRKLGRLEIIAEDLGLLTPEAERLRDALGFPGMRMLHAAFGDDGAYHRPHNYPRNSVAYPGTHDNDTTGGWLRSLPRSRIDAKAPDGLSDRGRLEAYVGKASGDLPWTFIHLLYTSAANTVVVPMQDVLQLGSAARMNTPATVDGNWEWRLQTTGLTAARADRLAALATVTERRPD